VAAYEEDVRQATRIVLGTSPGERVMRPTFGAGLRDLVFEPLSTTTMALAKHRVEVALATWEPRIDVKGVTVEALRDQGRMDITVSYVVRATNTFYNLVYPFYLLEGGER
jgi:phage baseplate assembly protein W